MKMITTLKTNNLLKQTNALGSYLDEMLHDATRLASKPACQPSKLEPFQSALLLELEIEKPKQKHKLGIQLDESEEAARLNEIETLKDSSLKLDAEFEIDFESRNEPLSSGLNMGHFPIQCLMFRVGNNLLSIPLIEMNGVVEWPDELTKLPQSPDFVLGVLKHRGTNLQVWDSAKVLGISNAPEKKAGHVLILSDKKSAISCDVLEDVVTLEYNDIQWQPKAGNALMHGVIRETLAYLLSPLRIIDTMNKSREI